MKKKIIIFAMSVTVIGAKAQTNFSATDTITVSKPKKNEIGINIVPFLSNILFAANPDVNRLSVSYKRILSDKSALRFALELDISYSNRQYDIQDTIFQGAENSLVKQREIYSDYFRPHVNLGYERFFGKRKGKWFYGADLVLGYYKDTYMKQNINYLLDSTSVRWIENGSPEPILTKKSTTVSIGISPFIGKKYSLSNKFSISMQVGVDCSFRQTKEEITDKNNNVTKSVFNSFDFTETVGLINNISIIYKL